MKYYRMTAELRAPLMIQRVRQSNASMGMNYLPGSSLRGALAATVLRLGETPESTAFRTLFLDQPVHFPNLLPTDDPETLSRVLPLTALSCKRKPGFSTENGHGVKDHLIMTAFSHMSHQATTTNSWLCRACENDLKPFTGFWNADSQTPRRYTATMVFDRHTGIDRQTGTVAHKIFYTTQAIANFTKEPEAKDHQPQYLSGGLFLSDEQFQSLSPLLTEGSIFVGAERTRGFGEISLSLTETDSPAIDLEEWNNGFKEQYRKFAEADPAPGVYFAVKLESHAVLVDQFLRPVSDLVLPFPEVAPILRVCKAETSRGWQSSWGLPKPDDIAVSMGSIYLFRYDGTDTAALENSLKQLLIAGIGLRKEEGFGNVSISDPLHIMEVI